MGIFEYRGIRVSGNSKRESFVYSLTFLITLLLEEVNITDHNKKLPPVKGTGDMGLYFSRLFLQDLYSIAPDAGHSPALK